MNTHKLKTGVEKKISDMTNQELVEEMKILWSAPLVRKAVCFLMMQNEAQRRMANASLVDSPTKS